MLPEANPPAEFDDNAGQVVESANPPEPSAPSAEPAVVEAVTDSSVDTDDFDYEMFEKSIPNEVVGDLAPQAPKVPDAPQAAAPVEVPAPVQPPAQPAVEPQPPVQPEPPKADVSPANEPAKAPTETAEPVDGFTALDNAIQASRDKVIDAVASGTYQLTAEELEGIQVEPEKAIPKLLARVHVNAVQGVIRHVAAQMPAVVSAVVQAREQTTRLEGEFFKAWPQLDKAKHGADIMKVGQVFRQLNPNATFNEFVRHVGAQVVLVHGLHTQAPPQQQQAAQRPPSAPPAFQPAGIGRASAPAQPAASRSVWDEMVEVMNE